MIFLELVLNFCLLLSSFRLMLWTFILTMSFSKATSLKINDYSHSYYIAVMDGDVTIWDEFGYLGLKEINHEKLTNISI